jgi:hypothetical protein
MIDAYTQVLSEGKSLPSQAVKGFSHKVGENVAGKNEPANDPTEKADLEKPSEDKKHSVSSTDGQLKKLKENSNVFDALYEKILAQENWEAEDDASGEQDSLMFSTAPGVEGGLEGEEEGEGEEESEEEGDPMSEVLSALKAAVAALEKVVGASEEGEEEGQELEEEEADSDSEESSEDEPNMEAVEAEELGTALVDLEKLSASLTSPKSQVVKGAVPVSKAKAQVPKGPKVDGTPSELKGDPEKLENKKNDTGGVRTGKGWYEQ